MKDDKYKGYNVPVELKKIVNVICKRYIINGVCDKMYISNLIANKNNFGDGRGNFEKFNIINVKETAESLQGAYGCNISYLELAELENILNGNKLDKDFAIQSLKKFMRRCQERLRNEPYLFNYLSSCLNDATNLIKEYQKK